MPQPESLLDTLGTGTQEADATVTIYHDGESIETLEITTETSDLLRQIDLNDQVHGGANEIRLEFEGTGIKKDIVSSFNRNAERSWYPSTPWATRRARS